MHKYSELLSKMILRELNSHGMTKGDLAKALKSPQSVVSRLLSPKHDPRLSTLLDVSKALKIQLWELLRPDNAVSTPAKPNPDVEALARMLSEREAELKILKEKLNSNQEFSESSASKNKTKASKMSFLPKDIIDQIAAVPAEKYGQLRVALKALIGATEKLHSPKTERDSS